MHVLYWTRNLAHSEIHLSRKHDMEDLTNPAIPIRHCRMFVVFFLKMSPFYLYNTVSPKVVYSVYPAALFGAISAVFSGKHPAINKGRKRYICFLEKIHMSHRESFIIPYISPQSYTLWKILDNFTVVVFFVSLPS